MRSEYSRKDLGKGTRGKYSEQFQEHSNVIMLDDDIADAFPDAQSVNDALRGLLRLAKQTSPTPRTNQVRN